MSHALSDRTGPVGKNAFQHWEHDSPPHARLQKVAVFTTTCQHLEFCCWMSNEKENQTIFHLFLVVAGTLFPLKLFTESVGITRVNVGWLYKIYFFERCMCIWECVWIQVRNGSKKGIPCPFSKFIENPSRTRYFHACFHEIHVVRYILKKLGLKPPGFFCGKLVLILYRNKILEHHESLEFRSTKSSFAMKEGWYTNNFKCQSAKDAEFPVHVILQSTNRLWKATELLEIAYHLANTRSLNKHRYAPKHKLSWGRWVNYRALWEPQITEMLVLHQHFWAPNSSAPTLSDAALYHELSIRGHCHELSKNRAEQEFFVCIYVHARLYSCTNAVANRDVSHSL